MKNEEMQFESESDCKKSKKEIKAEKRRLKKASKQNKKELKAENKRLKKASKQARKTEKRSAKTERQLEKKDRKVKKKILSNIKKAIKKDNIFKKKALKPDGLYSEFCALTVTELEELIIKSNSREEKAFYRTLLNLKLQIEQEKIIGESLL